MTPPPLISVIMPVYNAERYVAEAIQSILDQTFTDFELLIFNDGSTDKSWHIINSFDDKRIVAIQNQTNKGIVHSLNRGIKLAKGKYIARMDADDISLPERFEKQVNYLKKEIDCVIVGSSVKYIDANGNFTGARWKVSTNFEAIRIQLLFGCPFPHSSVMAHSSVLKEMLYNEDYYPAEDFHLWTKIGEEKKIGNIKTDLIKYRLHGENISFKKEAEQKKAVQRICKLQLEKFGIIFNEEELKLHAQIALSDIAKLDAEKLKSIKRWFKKLLLHNNTQPKFHHDCLSLFLERKWLSANILFIKNERFSLKYFIKSPLSSETVHSLFSFIKLLFQAFLKKYC